LNAKVMHFLVAQIFGTFGIHYIVIPMVVSTIYDRMKKLIKVRLPMYVLN